MEFNPEGLESVEKDNRNNRFIRIKIIFIISSIVIILGIGGFLQTRNPESKLAYYIKPNAGDWEDLVYTLNEKSIVELNLELGEGEVDVMRPIDLLRSELEKVEGDAEFAQVLNTYVFNHLTITLDKTQYSTRVRSSEDNTLRKEVYVKVNPKQGFISLGNLNRNVEKFKPEELPVVIQDIMMDLAILNHHTKEREIKIRKIDLNEDGIFLYDGGDALVSVYKYIIRGNNISMKQFR